MTGGTAMRLAPLLCVLASSWMAAAGAEASCSRRPLSQTRGLVDSFTLRPQGLFEQNPQGGARLEGSIREIVAVDPRLHADQVLRLLRTGINGAQRRSIGVGLAQAVVQCQGAGDSDGARRLNDLVRRHDDREMQVGFQATLRGPAPGALPAPQGAEPGRPLTSTRPLDAADPFAVRPLWDPTAPLR